MFVSLRPPSMASDGLPSAAPEQRKSQLQNASARRSSNHSRRTPVEERICSNFAMITQQYGELIERYQQRAAQRPATIRSNVRSLRMIVQVVPSGDLDEKSTSVLTADLVSRIREAGNAFGPRGSDTPCPEFDGKLRAPGAIDRRSSKDEILISIDRGVWHLASPRTKSSLTSKAILEATGVSYYMLFTSRRARRICAQVRVVARKDCG